MVLKQEQREIRYRNETFLYMHQYYECEDTHEKFTTTELDEANMNQVYNQYRAKHGTVKPGSG